MAQFNLPDVGEGLTEAEIVTWHVAVGDVVAINDVLVEIETAKSLVELPSPFAGEVTALLVAEGVTVEVGTPIIAIGADAPVPPPVPAAPAAEPVAREPMLVGYGPRDETVQRRRRRSNGPTRTSAPSGGVRKALATPPVRKFAKDLGIDISQVPSSGVVTRADVQAFATRLQSTLPAAAVPPPAQEAGTERRIPVTGVRKATADAMVRSAFTAPHASEWITLDITRTVTLVDRLRSDPRWSEIKVSPLLFVARAVCLALRQTPELNASWAGDEIILKSHVDLGVAAATERGLVVPHIRQAESLTLHELGVALADVIATARAGRSQPASLAPGSFTITNVGVFGIDAGTPILNPGESGILAIGAINRRPWVDENDQIVPRWVCTLALSFDHRIADGAHASRFLADVAAILRDPELALTY